MTERPNVPVLKTGVGLPTVGSNPPPSAKPDFANQSFVDVGSPAIKKPEVAAFNPDRSYR